MALQFQHILTGERVWAREIQGQALIQYLKILAEKRPVMRIPGLELAAADRLGGNARKWPGNTNDADTAPALSGGDGSDGFTRSAHQRFPRQK